MKGPNGDGLTPDAVAWRVWWGAPHEGVYSKFLAKAETLRFGRDASCGIRIGVVPLPDTRVPNTWAKLSWWDGQVIVKNLHDCLGLELVQHDGEDASFRASVFPGGIGSPPNSEYTLEATVPADKTRPSAVYALHIAAAPRSARPNIVRSGDNPAETAQVIDLTRTQKAVGRAVVAPLLAGRGHRASFKEISQTAYFSQSAVRDAIYAMDLRFVTAGLAVPDDGDALDRVSYVLRRHSFLVR